MKTNTLLKKCTEIVFLSLLIFFACTACNTRKTIEVYVSVEGNDNASGSLSEPFATIPQAVEAVRDLRKNGNTNPATIYLRDGRHQLNQTLVLGLEDGTLAPTESTPFEEYGAGPSTSQAHLTFAAYPGEKPVVSSGIPVTGWKLLESPPSELPAKAAGKVWVADIPEGLGKFYTLYDNQGLLNRARDAGFPVTKSGDRRTLHFPKGALRNWDNISDVEVQVRPGVAWVINMLPLESVDESTGIALTSVSASGSFTKLAPYLQRILGESAPTVWVENILDELDEPGEWVVNSLSRKIYLWPSNPSKTDGSPQGILAPTTSELIRVEGSIDYMGPEDIPVRGIAFSGLTFSHCDRWAWKKEEDKAGWGMQHDWDISDRPSSLLRFRGAEDCRVDNCTFMTSGGSGVRLDLHAQRNRIENCEFAHLGEAGIIMGGYGPGTKDVNHHNDVINNHIHHFSEITWHSPGIWAWQSGHNHIANNYVHHAGYSGILVTCRAGMGGRREGGRRGNAEGNRPENEESSKPTNELEAKLIRTHEIDQKAVAGAGHDYEGWKRREPYLHGRNNVIEYNEITHMVQLLSDGNGVYISGTGGGNIVRYNYLHDNAEAHLPAPIRCDGDQHETTILGNVIYNNSAFASAIAIHGVNHLINNFVVQPLAVPMKGYFSYIQYSSKDAQVHHNILVSNPEGGVAHGVIDKSIPGVPNIEEVEMDSNLYFHPNDPTWMDEHLARMRAVGKEKASLFADPMFTDPAGGDFSFKEGSPAIKLGIEELDVSKMGLLNKNNSLIK